MFFLAVFDSGANVWASIGKYFLSVVGAVVGAVVVGVAMAATVVVACAGIWVGNVV